MSFQQPRLTIGMSTLFGGAGVIGDREFAVGCIFADPGPNLIGHC
jgi:hypothetical protein